MKFKFKLNQRKQNKKTTTLNFKEQIHQKSKTQNSGKLIKT